MEIYGHGQAVITRLTKNINHMKGIWENIITSLCAISLS